MSSQISVAFRSDNHKVLNPNASGSDTIEARFDSHHVSYNEFCLAGSTKKWLLVDIEPDTMPGAMHKQVGKPGRFEDRTARSINITHSNACCNRF
jgi:hypothetical protein